MHHVLPNVSPNLFFEIHHITTRINSFFFFIPTLIMNWVLNKDFDREKEIGITGKGNSLGQRFETLGMVGSLLWT